jgi:hypothetical protein
LRVGAESNGKKADCQNIMQYVWVVLWLRRLVIGLSPRRHGFNARTLHVRFMVDKVALGLISVPVLPFPSVTIIPLTPHSNLFMYHQWYIILAISSVVK